ncbi:MAG TPA: serine protease, partial [Chloroflexota bacterium]|nr:serine protease [Chloroflexota bacterium]
MTVSDLSNQLADAVQTAAAWTVRVQARRGPPASGIVLGPDLIVTADHVIDPQREDQIKLGLTNGTEVDGKLVGRDPATDVAIIRASGAQLTPATAAQQD